MGLLEKLLARLEALEAKLDKLDQSVLTGDAPTTVSQVADETAAKVVSETTAATVVELAYDSSLTYKIPHDERIHSGMKTVNAKGDWKKRKGVNDITFSEVEAELIASVNGGETTPATPVPPTVPATPVPPTAPATPVPPTVPTAPDNPRVKVNKEIHELTQTYKVPFEAVTAVLLEQTGVDTVDAVAVDKLEVLAVLLKGWADYLEQCHTIADNFEDLEVKHPGNGLTDIVTAWCKQYGGATPGSVPKASISALYTELEKSYKQWSDYLTAQA